MEIRQKVIICGDSLMLAGVQASLRLNPAFDVIVQVLPITAQELQTLRPRAVIFDTQAVQPEFRYTIAQDLPGILLIGIDPGTNQALVWSGQQLLELSTQDLARVISQKN